MKKRIQLLSLLVVAACTGLYGQNYWNNKLQIASYRLPPPPVGFKPEYIDLNNDGQVDAIKTITRDSIPVLWLDDDGNMKPTDTEGDMVNDCLLIDRNADGKYDLVVKYADINNDGMADLQLIAEYPNNKSKGHYMYVIDTDKDQVFNYINWNTMLLECWTKNGISDFYTDYSGQSLFIKAHRITDRITDLRYNWENPFLFYDPDKDGLSEMTIRCCDHSVHHADAASKTPRAKTYKGFIDWAAISVDLDNDNAPGNDFDLDMTIMFAGEGFDIKDQIQKLSNMRGLKEADKFFPDARIRELTELIYPDHNSVWNLIFNRGKWEKVHFTFDEDDDCGRWERVELYHPLDPFNIGSFKKGVDHHPQSDVSGDRAAWDEDNSGKGSLYISKFDGRIHLYGAEWGCWRIDQNSEYFQGYSRNWQVKEPTEFATVKYTDTDNNGFIDFIEYDLDGDKQFETNVSFKELGISDECEVIEISSFRYNDYNKLFSKVSQGMWKNALKAVDVAKKYGINPLWYSKLQNPTSIQERYHDGYWLQFYLYKDLAHRFAAENKSELLKKLNVAYYTSNWNLL